MKLPITSITPFTLQDYPEHTACILWFSGCNMACGYCHNPDLVKGAFKKIPEEKIIDFLKSRKGLLDGVVLSGGECTLCPDIYSFVSQIKSLGFKVKIDTNGTNLELLQRLISERLVDFVALDFKAPKYKFFDITGYNDFDKFMLSLKLICSSGIDSEVRTTVHADMLSEEDVNNILQALEENNFKGKYYLQKFREGKNLGDLEKPARTFDTSKLANTNITTQFRGF